MSAFKDRTGQKFGRLLVLRRGPNLGKRVRWECACDCGTVLLVSATHLVTDANSCGCLRRDRHAEYANSVRKAYQQTVTGTRINPLYGIWRKMMDRCNNPDSSSYHWYGKLGVRVCLGWSRFETFVEEFGPRPSKKHSIDRVDTFANYSCGKCDECLAEGWPANCRWATAAQQGRNKRNTRVAEFGGVTLSVADWGDRLGIPASTLYQRIDAWGVHRALSTPYLAKKKKREAVVEAEACP